MINFENILARTDKKRTCKVGILGANGGFGYTFLAQVALMEKSLSLRVVCDRDSERTVAILKELGYDEKNIHPCKSEAEIRAVPDDGIVVLENSGFITATDADVVVEATGNPEGSALLAEKCLLSGKHVSMVSKEADVIAGPYLYRLAKSKGLVYSIAIGDQPANLINWISYIRALGMAVVCAGKSSEYDFIYDPITGDFEYRDQRANIPELAKYWNMGDMEKTLRERSRLLAAYPQFAVPDYNEMNVVANATGLLPSCPRLHYPMINVAEMADVYALKEDGGLLDKPGVLDSFNCFHRFDEVSFAGGVFVIVKNHNDAVIDLLAAKEHVISKNKKYAALYLPYHYMGMEAPMSVLQAYYLGLSSYSSCDNVGTMVCRTERDFKKGERLDLHTHHRCLMDMYVTFEPTADQPANIAPYYLIAEKTVVKDIPKGTVITTDMVDLSTSGLKRMMDSVKNFG
jgi:predicted homoserine dehydrogenase-like protein